MRICHVSPHLPPDQAANALLPASSGPGAARAARGHVRHAPPTQGGRPTSTWPARVYRVRRPARGARLARCSRLDAVRGAGRFSPTLDARGRGADLLHLHSNGLIVEVAAAWARRAPGPVRAHALRHRDLALPPALAPRSVHPRLPTRRGGHLLQPGVCAIAPRASDSRRPGLSVIYPAGRRRVRGRTTRHPRALAGRSRHPPEPHVILNVKRLHELAGQRYLIDAFARLAARPR